MLVPKLLRAGYEVVVYDLMLFGNYLPDHPNLQIVEADLRDTARYAASVAGCDAVIHLACISNDPSFELDPDLSKSDQLRLLRAAGHRLEEGRRSALRLHLLQLGLRGQRRPRGHRGPSARSAHATTTSTRACASRSCSKHQSPDFTTRHHPAGHGLRLLARACASTCRSTS